MSPSGFVFIASNQRDQDMRSTLELHDLGLNTFQLAQRNFAVLARERHRTSAAVLLLLHARNAMVRSIIDLDIASAEVHGEAAALAEERIPCIILTAG